MVRRYARDLEESGHWVGRKSATRILYVFSDYQCPFCRDADSAVVNWVRDNADAAAVYIDFPLVSLHPAAFGAACAASCAEAQGRYLEMHRELMTTLAWQSDADWRREAIAAGVQDTQAFSACVGSEASRRRVLEGMRVAALFKITGTPAFFTRNGALAGPVDAKVLSHLR